MFRKKHVACKKKTTQEGDQRSACAANRRVHNQQRRANNGEQTSKPGSFCNRPLEKYPGGERSQEAVQRWKKGSTGRAGIFERDSNSEECQTQATAQQNAALDYLPGDVLPAEHNETKRGWNEGHHLKVGEHNRL